MRGGCRPPPAAAANYARGDLSGFSQVIRIQEQVTLASSPDVDSCIALQLEHNEKRTLTATGKFFQDILAWWRSPTVNCISYGVAFLIGFLMEFLEEFMFARPGQLSQLAYEASISNAPNASALAKLATAAYAASLPLVSPLTTPVLSHDRATAASGFFLAGSAPVGSRSRLVFGRRLLRVEAARKAGATWSEIGLCYGLTKQGAQQRFRAARNQAKAGTAGPEPG